MLGRVWGAKKINFSSHLLSSTWANDHVHRDRCARGSHGSMNSRQGDNLGTWVILDKGDVSASLLLSRQGTSWAPWAGRGLRF